MEGQFNYCMLPVGSWVGSFNTVCRRWAVGGAVLILYVTGGQLSQWAVVSGGQLSMVGSCHCGQLSPVGSCHGGQLSPVSSCRQWAAVPWGSCRVGRCRRGQLSGGEMSAHPQLVLLYRNICIDKFVSKIPLFDNFYIGRTTNPYSL